MKCSVGGALFCAMVLLFGGGCTDCSDCPDCPEDSSSPPVVSIIYPADGDTLSGRDSVVVQIEARSTTGPVDRVVAWVDGQLLSDKPDFVAPFEFVWACSMEAMGSHFIRTEATTFQGLTGSATSEVRLGYCDEFEVRGILRADEGGYVYGGDVTDWCYENGGNVGPHNISPVFPNPCGASVGFRFVVGEPDTVSIRVYDDHCRLIKDVDMGLMEPGGKSIIWSAVDDNGNFVPKGLYACIIKIGDYECYGDIQLEGSWK